MLNLRLPSVHLPALHSKKRYQLLLGCALMGLLTPVQGQTKRPTPPDPKQPVIAPVAPKNPTKVASDGQFTDKSNVKHNWQINTAHTLIWDGKPYLPVGGSFTPHSFALSESKTDDVAWQEDVHALETLKASGIQDILLSPDRPLVDIPIKSIQRLLDYLDAKDFHYGVSFGPGITQMTSGFVVKPTVYRKDARPNPSNDTILTAEWLTSNTDRGVVFMYDGASDSKMFQIFDIGVKDGIASVPVEAPASITHPYVLLLPHKTTTASDQGSLPDIWSKFDSYRDRLITMGSQLKWGAGLRFFIDPLSRNIGLGGETPFLVPDSAAFRLEWESSLSRKYGDIETLRVKWGLADKITSFAAVARLIPLWAYGRGCPYFFDPESRKAYRLLEGSQSASNSQWWNDFLQFRDNSISYYMNTAADVLKHQTANVPVVYTGTPNGPFFTNYRAEGGFDGLAVAIRSDELSHSARIIGPLYSQAEQSVRTTWFLTSKLTASAPVPASPNNNNFNNGNKVSKISTVALTNADTAPPASALSAGYTSKALLTHDMDEMRRIGSKGIFVNSLYHTSSAALPASFERQSLENKEWISNPDGLAWLSDYATTLHRDNSAPFLRPHILFYPQNAPGPAHIGMVPGASSVYWLPGAFIGDNLDLWPYCWGYTIRRDQEEPLSTVLVSLTGPQKAHFPVLNPSLVKAYTADGLPVQVKIYSKNSVEIPLDTAPVIVQFGSDVPPVPEEAALAATLQLDLLYEIAKLQKIFGVDNSKLAIERAKDYIFKKNYGQAYVYARAELDNLIVEAAPYIWIEGEEDRLLASKNALFNEVAGHPEASNGVYLRLATPNRPTPEYGYKARYEFATNHEGVYQIWMAGTIPGPNTSPIKWRLNNDADKDIFDSTPRGPLYMNERFGWVLLGTAKLGKGEQKLTIDVTDPALATHEYTFAIDALMITDKNFTPNGTIRPQPVDEAMARDYKREKRVLNPKPHYAP